MKTDGVRGFLCLTTQPLCEKVLHVWKSITHLFRGSSAVHMSSSDEEPHVTIAAATDRMKQEHQHVAVHSRVTNLNWKVAVYTGSSSFNDNLRADSNDLRRSYRDPLRARTSLMSDIPNAATVGCTREKDGTARWYILNDELEVVYLQNNTFYTVGQGSSAYLAFLHPVLNRPCRALFLGHERPEPYSPDPRPTNLEGQMENLTLAPVATHQTWVTPFVILDKDIEKSVAFEIENSQVVRSRWQSWELIQDGGQTAFRLQAQGSLKGREFWAYHLPATTVAPWSDPSSDRPIHFRNSGSAIVQTKRKRWIAGMNEGFFVYIHSGEYYLAYRLPDDA